jgi:hypothetical protein
VPGKRVKEIIGDIGQNIEQLAESTLAVQAEATRKVIWRWEDSAAAVAATKGLLPSSAPSG